ncbi:hypothetical protein IIG_01701 [Bacillus cereus VD048]|uniref:Novel toxin 15 domain-containing protein n=1 Tax=Bacillus cereus VD048 TaxID=1053226 RepID=J8I898_BACCE|nr:hypothetical protein IIG_01701 [Bacillus cereus VD048]
MTRKILWLKNNLIFECENDKASYTKGGHIRLHKGAGEVKHLDDIPRIKEIEVKFNYKTKFDSEEFARQLKDQEKGMNELTVHEYRGN